MHFMQLSTTHGLNLDHVIEWYDYPDLSTPWVSILCSAPSEHESGQRHPHETRLVGTERDTFLRWVETEAADAQYAADPNTFATHVRMAEQHLQALCADDLLDTYADRAVYESLIGDLVRVLTEVRTAAQPVA